MNIHALLSPTDSPSKERRESSSSASSSSSPQRSRVAASSGRRISSTLSHEITRTPEKATSNSSSRPTTADDSPSQSSPTRAQQAFPLPPLSRAYAPNFRPLHPPSSAPRPTSHPVQSPSQQGSVQFQRPVVTHRPSSTPQMETLAGESRTISSETTEMQQRHRWIVR